MIKPKKKKKKHTRDSEQEARDVEKEKETQVYAKEAKELFDIRSQLRKKMAITLEIYILNVPV